MEQSRSFDENIRLPGNAGLARSLEKTALAGGVSNASAAAVASNAFGSHRSQRLLSLAHSTGRETPYSPGADRLTSVSHQTRWRERPMDQANSFYEREATNLETLQFTLMLALPTGLFVAICVMIGWWLRGQAI